MNIYFWKEVTNRFQRASTQIMRQLNLIFFFFFFLLSFIGYSHSSVVLFSSFFKILYFCFFPTDRLTSRTEVTGSCGQTNGDAPSVHVKRNSSTTEEGGRRRSRSRRANHHVNPNVSKRFTRKCVRRFKRGE